MQREALSRARDLAQAWATATIKYKNLNAFITLKSKEDVAAALGASSKSRQSNASALSDLDGSLLAIKDNIATADLPTTCASRGLESYQSPYDATVVSLLRRAGGIVVGKTNLDEFGMGSHSTHSSYGPVTSPWKLPQGGQDMHESFSAGGSSGGSAVAVATHQCQGALGTDTGGSVRLPAAYTGIFGFKPSYGLVSRWGVVSYANSLDTVGFLARDVKTIKSMFDITNFHDKNDPTSMLPVTREKLARILRTRGELRSLRIGVPAEYNTQELSPTVREAWLKTLDRVHADGHSIHEVSLPTTKHALSAYYVLAPAEASSNLAKYDGVRYGSSASQDGTPSGHLYSRSRQQGFGDEVRRRILLGSYSLSAEAMDNYFIQAQKIRRLVQRDFDDIFAFPSILRDPDPRRSGNIRVDALICPTAPTKPPTSTELASLSPLEAYTSDVFTVPASLAGLPAISVPVITGTQWPPTNADAGTGFVGMQIITQYGDDNRALSIAATLESATSKELARIQAYHS